jgi:hypothetical protein
MRCFDNRDAASVDATHQIVEGGHNYSGRRVNFRKVGFSIARAVAPEEARGGGDAADTEKTFDDAKNEELAHVGSFREGISLRGSANTIHPVSLFSSMFSPFLPPISSSSYSSLEIVSISILSPLPLISTERSGRWSTLVFFRGRQLIFKIWGIVWGLFNRRGLLSIQADWLWSPARCPNKPQPLQAHLARRYAFSHGSGPTQAKQR